MNLNFFPEFTPFDFDVGITYQVRFGYFQGQIFTRGLIDLFNLKDFKLDLSQVSKSCTDFKLKVTNYDYEIYEQSDGITPPIFLYCNESNIHLNYDWGLVLTKIKEKLIAPVDLEPIGTTTINRSVFETDDPCSFIYGFKIIIDRVQTKNICSNNLSIEIDLDCYRLDRLNLLIEWILIRLDQTINLNYTLPTRHKMAIVEDINLRLKQETKLVLRTNLFDHPTILTDNLVEIVNDLNPNSNFLKNKAIMLNSSGKKCLIFLRNNGTFLCMESSVIRVLNYNFNPTSYILEAEYIHDDHDRKIFVSDVIYAENKNIFSYNLVQRRQCLKIIMAKVFSDYYQIITKPIWFPQDHSKLFAIYKCENGLLFKDMETLINPTYLWLPKAKMNMNFLILKNDNEIKTCLYYQGKVVNVNVPIIINPNLITEPKISNCVLNDFSNCWHHASFKQIDEATIDSVERFNEICNSIKFAKDIIALKAKMLN